MLEIINLYNKSQIGVKVSFHGRELEFTIGPLISKRNKDELDNGKQFQLFNAYLDYKGDEFKEAYFNLLQTGDEEIMMSISKKEIHPLPYKMVHDIINLFDMLDLFNYIKNVYKIKPPSNLMDEFDPMIEKDDKGTRVQTYLKDDYLELAALSMVIKATLPLVGHFLYVRQKEIYSDHSEYLLFNFYRQHRIYESAPMVKLLGFIGKLIAQPNLGADAESIRVFEVQTSKDEMDVFYLAKVVLQRVAIATVIDDNDNRSLINKIYNYANNRLKSTGDTSKIIRDKTALTDVESGSGDKESMFESYRIMTDLPANYVVEFNSITNSVNKVMNQLPKGMLEVIDNKVLLDAVQFTKVFTNGNFTPYQINVLAITFKHFLDPRSINQITADNLVNLTAIMFAYMWGLGYQNLAVLFTAQIDNTTEDAMSINITVNKSRVPKEVKEELDILFPYKRVINDTTEVNTVEEFVNEISNEMFDKRWIPTADDKYITEIAGNKNYKNILPADLKIQLSKFIIEHEGRRI